MTPRRPGMLARMPRDLTEEEDAGDADEAYLSCPMLSDDEDEDESNCGGEE